MVRKIVAKIPRIQWARAEKPSLRAGMGSQESGVPLSVVGSGGGSALRGSSGRGGGPAADLLPQSPQNGPPDRALPQLLQNLTDKSPPLSIGGIPKPARYLLPPYREVRSPRVYAISQGAGFPASTGRLRARRKRSPAGLTKPPDAIPNGNMQELPPGSAKKGTEN